MVKAFNVFKYLPSGITSGIPAGLISDELRRSVGDKSIVVFVEYGKRRFEKARQITKNQGRRERFEHDNQTGVLAALVPSDRSLDDWLMISCSPKDPIKDVMSCLLMASSIAIDAHGKAILNKCKIEAPLWKPTNLLAQDGDDFMGSFQTYSRDKFLSLFDACTKKLNASPMLKLEDAKLDELIVSHVQAHRRSMKRSSIDDPLTSRKLEFPYVWRRLESATMKMFDLEEISHKDVCRQVLAGCLKEIHDSRIVLKDLH